MGFVKLFITEQRRKLNLKANEVAKFTGIATGTQSNYEKGKRSPNAIYLKKLVELGFDINYVLTGGMSNIAESEEVLLDLYRKAPKEVQEFILGALQNQN